MASTRKEEEGFLNWYVMFPQDFGECELEHIVEPFVTRTIQNLESCVCLHKVCNFKIDEVVKTTVKRVARRDGSLLVWAPTQAGKSSYKAVELACYLTMGMHIILCTKSKNGGVDLARKIRQYFYGSVFEEKVFDVYKKEELFAKLEEEPTISYSGFVLVIPDTGTQIDTSTKIMKNIKNLLQRNSERIASGFRFGLILDECDAIQNRSPDECDAIQNRSPDHSQDNEVKMKTLIEELEIGIITQITATPIPVIKENLDKGERIPRIFEIPTSSGYCGTEALKAYEEEGLTLDAVEASFPAIGFRGHNQNNNSKTQLFTSCKKQMATKFPLSRKSDYIPGWNDQCDALMKSVFKTCERSALVLVATCPFVASEKGNIFEQAAWVQDHFLAKGKKFVTIAVHADKRFYRLPGDRYGYECKKNICELLNAVDKKFGLNVPAVIFGYHAMKRGISYRSNERVPTHAIMFHRRGQSIENVRQAAGRATFNGKCCREENRTSSLAVSTLMSREDLALVKAHDPVVRNLIQLANQSSPPLAEMRMVIEEYQGSTKRKSGMHDARKKASKKAKTTN